MSSPDGIFAGPTRRVDRARDRAWGLEEQVDQFLKDKPFSFMTEFDAQRSRYLHKAVLVKNLPTSVELDVYDVFHYSRSALDLAIAELVRRGGQPDNRCQFPFARQKRDLSGAINRCCKGIPEPVVKVIRSFRPYESGNDLLWSLNEVRRIGMHRQPIEVRMAPVGRPLLHEAERDHILPPAQLTPNGEIIYAESIAPDKPDVTITTTLTFAAISGVEGQPVINRCKEVVILVYEMLSQIHRAASKAAAK